MIRVNIDTFRQIGDRHIRFKTKVTLIICVFSGSDVGSNWQLLYSLLRPTTKDLNRACLPLHRSWHNGGLMAAHLGSNLICSCQSTVVGTACAELRHSDRNIRTAWFEKVTFKKNRDLKQNTGWIFIIIGWMCTHTSNTHLCSNYLKSEFCIRWPL